MSKPWYETAFGAHYPTLYGHRDDREAARAVTLLSELGALAAPVLDLGCGDGRHLPPLQTVAGTVFGLDLSAPLLAAARKRVAAVPLLRGDMRALPCRDAALGSVLSLFTAFGYFADAVQNERPVAEIGRVLRPGGHWCLDYLDADRVTAELGDGLPVVRTRVAGPFQVTETRVLDLAVGVARKLVAVAPAAGCRVQAREAGLAGDQLEYEERVRLFTLAELDAMALRAGLERVAARGGYAGEALGEGSRWLLVYRRREAT